jgi:1-acyl-sn-glycerol-3-phosphate acyltransferase
VAAGSRFDVSWARGPVARAVRDGFLCFVLGPIIRHYTGPRVLGDHHLDRLQAPVIFAANHSSHLDTPVILGALPPPWRRRTAVVAAADYFYRNAFLARLVTLAFGTIPVDRKGGLSRASAQRLNQVLGERWNLLLYPEGTRSRDGGMGRLRSGAARLAVDHGVALVPIHVWGSHASMPPGRPWPRHHPIVVRIGAPLRAAPDEDHRALTERLEGSLSAMRRRSAEGAPD